MNSPETVGKVAFDNEPLTRVERLLLQYPGVSESEVAEIVHFLRDGTILEISLLSMNRDAWRNAERIRTERPKMFATTRREYLRMGSALGAIILILALFWAIAI